MSAEDLGRQILREVKGERLDELLQSLRALEPPKNQYRLGIPALDSLISIFHPFPASQPVRQPIPQTLPWTTQESQAPTPQKLLPELKPPIIEIAGATACSGKTQLLYQVIAQTLLPRQVNDITLNGKEGAVVLFDLSSSLSILRLYDIISAKISAASPSALDPTELHNIVHASLQHLHVYRPQSLPSLLSALDSLETYLLSMPPAHLSAPRQLGLIALSNLSAFFWPLRLEAEDSTFATTSSDLFLTQHRQLVASLRSLQTTFSCPVIAANMTLSPPIHSNNKSEGVKIRPHMPAVWNNSVTLKIVLQRNAVTKFGPEISVQEAERERGMRWEAVQKAGWRGWVDWWGAEGWDEAGRVGVGWSEVEKEGVRRLERERGGGLGFKIGQDGVEWEEE